MRQSYPGHGVYIAALSEGLGILNDKQLSQEVCENREYSVRSAFEPTVLPTHQAALAFRGTLLTVLKPPVSPSIFSCDGRSIQSTTESDHDCCPEDGRVGLNAARRRGPRGYKIRVGTNPRL